MEHLDEEFIKRSGTWIPTRKQTEAVNINKHFLLKQLLEVDIIDYSVCNTYLEITQDDSEKQSIQKVCSG